MTERLAVCRSCDGGGLIYKWPLRLNMARVPPWYEPESYGCPECRGSGVVPWMDYFDSEEDVDALG